MKTIKWDEINWAEEPFYQFGVYHKDKPEEVILFNKINELFPLMNNMDDNGALIFLCDIINIVEKNNYKDNKVYFLVYYAKPHHTMI